MDCYDSFAELSKHEKPFRDYHILMRKGPSGIAIMAPHGGRIEFGTAAIAESIAHPEHTFWAFRGIKKGGNRMLHIASTRYDVPGALDVALAAKTVVTIHGCRDRAPAVYVGGRHRELALRIQRSLREAGFDAQRNIRRALRGESPVNLCNRCSSGKGVQLEITAGLRKRMFTWPTGKGIIIKRKSYHRFTRAVKDVLMC